MNSLLLIRFNTTLIKGQSEQSLGLREKSNDFPNVV